MSSFRDLTASSERQPDPHHSASGEPLRAPFRVIADFRQAVDGWQFTNVPDRMHPSQHWTAPIEYRYLPPADYMVLGLDLYFVRHDATDFLAMQRHWPDSIAQQRAELVELQAEGASCLIVIEGDAQTIGQVLRESDLLPPLDPASPRFSECDVPWLLAESHAAAEQMVFEIMHRAWQHAQAQKSNPSN
jgi:hypothetical protein